jgi:hypothetical protein
VKFTDHELLSLEVNPEALEAAADYNDVREAEADAMDVGNCAEYHKNRAHELRLEAAAQRMRIENGYGPEGYPAIATGTERT